MELGVTVKDRITGFTGVVTGFVKYISGCNQALVQPRVKDDGAFADSHWFDVQRLEVQDQPRVELDNSETPGPDKAAPIR